MKGTYFWEINHNRALWTKWMFLIIKYVDECSGILLKADLIPGVDYWRAFISLTKLILDWDLNVSMKFRILYATFWAKMNVSSKQKLIYRDESCEIHTQVQKLIFLPDIILLKKFAFR
jgi:hypothetical protein